MIVLVISWWRMVHRLLHHRTTPDTGSTYRRTVGRDDGRANQLSALSVNIGGRYGRSSRCIAYRMPYQFSVMFGGQKTPFGNFLYHAGRMAESERTACRAGNRRGHHLHGADLLLHLLLDSHPVQRGGHQQQT